VAWNGMDVTIIVVVITVGWALTYISSHRGFRRVVTDLRLETELQLYALTGTVTALQKQVAEMSPPPVIEPAATLRETAHRQNARYRESSIARHRS